MQSHCRSITSRTALLEDDAYVAYFYLTVPRSQVPERQVLVYSRIPPVSRNDAWSLAKTGELPLLPKDIASGSAVLSKPASHEFGFRWATDCNAVVVQLHGIPLAMLVTIEPIGRPKALRESSSLGQPWDQRRYESTFGR